MLSSAAFNALLKTLEEPPPDVKFMLATTELRKVPATILSRCAAFHATAYPGARASFSLHGPIAAPVTAACVSVRWNAIV
jgi:hypothetical protein